MSKNNNTNKLKEKEKYGEMYYPDRYIDRITDIDSNFFKKRDIKGVIIDIDNTIIDIKRNVVNGLVEWKDELKENDIEVTILSNTFDKPKAQKLAKLLDVKSFIFGRKPGPKGFLKAQKHLELPVENIAVIGDQIFTDLLGANRAGMHSILVNPIQEKKDYLPIKWKRKLEENILKEYFGHVLEVEKNPEKHQVVLETFEKRLQNRKTGIVPLNTTKLKDYQDFINNYDNDKTDEISKKDNSNFIDELIVDNDNEFIDTREDENLDRQSERQSQSNMHER